MTARLLIVDPDPKYGEWLRHHLGVICDGCERTGDDARPV